MQSGKGEGDVGTFSPSFPSLRDPTTISERQTFPGTGITRIKALTNLSASKPDDRVPFPHLDESDSPVSPSVGLPPPQPVHAPVLAAGALERRLSVDSLLHSLRHAGGLHHSSSDQDLRGHRPPHPHTYGSSPGVGHTSRLHTPHAPDTNTNTGVPDDHSYGDAAYANADNDTDNESAARPSRVKTPPQYIHARRISNIYHFDSVGKVLLPRVAPRPRSISVSSDGEGSPLAGRGEVLEDSEGMGVEIGVEETAGFTFGSGTGVGDTASPHGRGVVLEGGESPGDVGRTMGLGLTPHAIPTTGPGRVVLPPYQGPLPVPVVSAGEEDAQWPERKGNVSMIGSGYAPEQYFMGEQQLHQQQHGHSLPQSYPYSYSHSQGHAHSSYHEEHQSQHASQHQFHHQTHQPTLEQQLSGHTRRQHELRLVSRHGHGHGHGQVRGESGLEGTGERERDVPPERNRIDVGKIERGEETRTTVSVYSFLFLPSPFPFHIFCRFLFLLCCFGLLFLLFARR